jgi:hypothetical protein
MRFFTLLKRGAEQSREQPILPAAEDDDEA